MSKPTKQEQVIAALVARGCREVASGSKRYRKFTNPDGRLPLYVGQQGAVRVGRTVSDSVNVTDAWHRYLGIGGTV